MSAQDKPEQSSEGFHLNEKGEKEDAAFHEEMLSSPEGQKASRDAAIRAAVNAGIELETAKRLFGEIQE